MTEISPTQYDLSQLIFNHPGCAFAEMMTLQNMSDSFKRRQALQIVTLKNMGTEVIAIKKENPHVSYLAIRCDTNRSLEGTIISPDMKTVVRPFCQLATYKEGPGLNMLFQLSIDGLRYISGKPKIPSYAVADLLPVLLEFHDLHKEVGEAFFSNVLNYSLEMLSLGIVYEKWPS